MTLRTLTTAIKGTLWLLAIVLLSCTDDHDVHIRHITTRTAADNMLRIPVTIDFNADCDYTISYWESTRPDDVVTTPQQHTQGSQGQTTLTFLKASTDYTFRVNVIGGEHSSDYTFTTQPLPIEVPTYTLAVDKLSSTLNGYVLQWEASVPGYITFSDMKGNVVWYQRFPEAIRTCTYDPATQTLQLMTGFADEDNYYRLCAHMIRIDLEGHTLVNWTPSQRGVNYPHHEFKLMPDGNMLFVSNIVQQFDLTSIGGTDNHTVWGDGFVITSPEGQQLYQWSCFDELSPLEANAYVNTLKVADDFVHANSVNYDSNGDYYMTFNRLSELWKIDRHTGKVIYRVGPHGNVTIPDDALASGLHCAEPLSPDRILCFDNGKSSGISRAIIYDVDPHTMTATATLSIPLPPELSSTDRSNAQLLDDTHMFFGSTQGHASIITDMQGHILWQLTRTGISYRSYYFRK